MSSAAGKIIKRLIVCLSFIILALTVLSIFYFLSSNHSVSALKKTVLLAAVVIGLFAESYLAVKISTKNPNLFIGVVLLAAALSCILWNFYARTQLVSDYKVLWEGASDIAKGKFGGGFDLTGYFYIYNYQIGYAAYLGFLMKFLGTNLLLFKLLEILYLCGTVLMIILITGKVFGARTAAIASTLYATFLFNIMGSSVINNQHLSALLLLIGIYLVILEKPWSIFCSGAVFALMNIIRPLGIILIIGVVLYSLIRMLEGKERRRWLIGIAAFLVAYFALVTVSNLAFEKSNLAPNAVSKNHLPYFKLVIGLGAENGSLFGNKQTDTRKTAVYYDLKTLGFNYDKYNQACLDFIKSKLGNYRSTAHYVFQKMRTFMGEKDNQDWFALNLGQYSGALVTNLSTAAHIQYFLFAILALFSLVLMVKKGSEIQLFYILFLGFMLVHVLVEAQTRYRYEIYILMILFAAESLGYLMDKIVTGFPVKRSKGK